MSATIIHGQWAIEWTRRTVPRLSAILGEVTHLITVVALHVLRASGMGALARLVSHLLAVATLDALQVQRLGTLLSDVALRIAVAAAALGSRRTILGKVSH
jgi:hypothetical protein